MAGGVFQRKGLTYRFPRDCTRDISW